MCSMCNCVCYLGHRLEQYHAYITALILGALWVSGIVGVYYCKVALCACAYNECIVACPGVVVCVVHVPYMLAQLLARRWHYTGSSTGMNSNVWHWIVHFTKGTPSLASIRKLLRAWQILLTRWMLSMVCTQPLLYCEIMCEYKSGGSWPECLLCVLCVVSLQHKLCRSCRSLLM